MSQPTDAILLTAASLRTTTTSAEVRLLIYSSVASSPFFAIQFKEATTLDTLIKELARCRREVWPAAEPINTEEPNEQKI